MARAVKPKKVGVRESTIEARGVALLKKLDCLTVKVGRDGYPDRLVIWASGQHFWWEVKAQDGRLQPTQAVMVARLGQKGERVIVGDDSELERWVKTLRNIRDEARKAAKEHADAATRN